MSEAAATNIDRSGRLDRLVTPAGALLCGLVVAVAVLGARHAGWLFPLEMRAYDAMTAARPPAAAEQSPCVVVRISERDITGLFKQYPISDARLADLLERLLAMRPKTIGVDLFRDIEVPDVRDGFAFGRLQKLWLGARNVYGIHLISDSDLDRVGRPKALGDGAAAAARAGFNNVPEDSDGLVRRGLLYLHDPATEQSEPAFALLLAMNYLGLRFRDIAIEDAPGSIRLGQARIDPAPPAFGAYVPRRGDAGGDLQVMLDWRSPRKFARYDVTEVMSPDFDAARIADKLVLVGVLTTSVKDYLPTPIDAYTAGVEFHAHVADQLVRAGRGESSPGVRAWGDAAEAAWIAGWAVLGGAIGLLTRTTRLVPALIAAAAVLVGGCYFAMHRDLWLPLVPALAGLIAAAGLSTAWSLGREWADRQAWAALTGKLVSPAIADALWQSRRDLFDHGRMRPRQMTATVLFFDLKGFTAMSERATPEEMIDLLNEFFQEMSTTVEQHGGVVNKYVGDQIMALFGPPLPRTTDAHFRRDAQNAVRCAVALRAKLGEMNQQWKPLGRPTIFMRVGIHTGPLVAGSLGSRDRLEYTVIGDTVNTASRLESVDKDLFDEQVAPGNCRIFIGQPTADYLDGSISLRRVPIAELKGKAEAIAVYAVV